MRGKNPLQTTACLLIAMILFALPASTAAQDGPPAARPTPAPAGPDAVRVVSVPFSDTFETTDTWLPRGAWAFDTQTAYEGGAWRLDAAWRQKESVLEYRGLIDLNGLLGAQLMFRQKGTLPTSDLITVDVSLDGGLSWVLVDQQIGVEADDWALHTVDLARFRGQVIRLRLRVSTGIAMPAEPGDVPLPPAYAIDNLTIQYRLPEEVGPPEGPLLPGTLAGLHLTLGADPGGVLDMIKKLRAAGWTLGTLKGTTGTEDLLNEVAVLSPETVIVYRSLLTPWGQIDCPDHTKSPISEAQVWMGGLSTFWDEVDADYYEIMNECFAAIEGNHGRSIPMDWLAQFSIEAMRIANEQGRCLLLFSFAGGTPEIAEFAQLTPVFEYALNNPCRSGRYHGIALHSYSGSPGELVSESNDWLGYRHRRFLAEIVRQLPAAAEIPVYLTEAGPGNGYIQFSCQDIVRDIVQYTDRLQPDTYIKGFHLWTLGFSALDLTPCLGPIGDALVAYYAGR